MHSTPSTSDDEPIEGVVIEGALPADVWDRVPVIGFDGASDDFGVYYYSSAGFHYWGTNPIVWDYLSRPRQPSVHFIVEDGWVFDTQSLEAWKPARKPRNMCPFRPEDWISAEVLDLGK